MRTFKLQLLVAGFVSASFLGCGSSRDLSSNIARNNPDAVAVIAGEPMSLHEFEERYARSIGGRERASQDSMEDYEEFLERYVNFRLKVLEAKSLGLHELPEVVEELEQYRNQLGRPYLLDQEVIRPLAREIYDRQQEEIRASHIMVMLPGNAPSADTVLAHRQIHALLDSVRAGMPFADVASKYSEDPSAGHNRGDLGYFTAGRMVEEFEEVAYRTPVGEISEPFRTQYGFHIMKVEDRRPATPEIRASHILIRPMDGSEESRQEALNQITEVKQRIDDGEDFATLARQYSQDGSAQAGGDLGFFGAGRMVEPFNTEAFALQEIGDVSGIVETQFGFHLIKLTDRQQPQTFEEAYPQLKQMLSRMPRYQRAERDFASETLAGLPHRVDEEAVDALIATFPADSVAIYFTRGQFEETPGQDAAVSVADRTFSLTEVAAHARANRLAPGEDQRRTVSEYIQNFMREQALNLAVESLGDRDAEFNELMSQYSDGVLLFRISEDSVWNAAVADTSALLSHYAENRARYRFPERLRVIGFYASADSTLDEARRLFEEGHSVEDIVLELDGRSQFRADTTFLADSTNSVYDNAFALEPGTFSDVLQHRRGRIMLYLDGIEAPREKTFEEARAEVVNEYQTVLEERWIERLRSRYAARTFPERLSGAFGAQRGGGERTAYQSVTDGSGS